MLYKVEVFDDKGNIIEYYDDTPDGYCAELNARKKYPNYKISSVIKIENKIEG